MDTEVKKSDYPEPSILESFVHTLKENTPKEVGRLLQNLQRDKFEYEEAKKIIESYETRDCNNDIIIEACEKVLKEKNE